ncbi:MAG: hypothetical protein ACUBOA_14775 [Candidatus Loosdrechtia sp.]
MIIVKDTIHRLNPEGVTENTDSSCYPFGIIVVLCHPFGVTSYLPAGQEWDLISCYKHMTYSS